jgi:hypothetical protein
MGKSLIIALNSKLQYTQTDKLDTPDWLVWLVPSCVLMQNDG